MQEQVEFSRKMEWQICPSFAVCISFSLCFIQLNSFLHLRRGVCRWSVKFSTYFCPEWHLGDKTNYCTSLSPLLRGLRCWEAGCFISERAWDHHLIVLMPNMNRNSPAYGPIFHNQTVEVPHLCNVLRGPLSDREGPPIGSEDHA